MEPCIELQRAWLRCLCDAYARRKGVGMQGRAAAACLCDSLLVGVLLRVYRRAMMGRVQEAAGVKAPLCLLPATQCQPHPFNK